MDRKELAAIRTAVANYMRSEGCTCCRDVDEHEKHQDVLGKMLRMKKYDDGSGYDFWRYATPRGSARGKR